MQPHLSSSTDNNRVKARWNRATTCILLFRPDMDDINNLCFVRCASREFDLVVHGDFAKRDKRVRSQTRQSCCRGTRVINESDKMCELVLEIDSTILIGKAVE